MVRILFILVVTIVIAIVPATTLLAEQFPQLPRQNSSTSDNGPFNARDRSGLQHRGDNPLVERNSQQISSGLSRSKGLKLERSDKASTRNGKEKPQTLPNSIGKTLMSLAFVIGLIVAVAWVVRKHGRLVSTPLPNAAVESLGRHQIDPRNAVHLLRCGSRVLILGVTPESMTTLSEITDPIEVDLLAGLCEERDEDAGVVQSFRQLFQQRANSKSASTDGLTTESIEERRQEPRYSTERSHG